MLEVTTICEDFFRAAISMTISQQACAHMHLGVVSFAVLIAHLDVHLHTHPAPSVRV